MTAVALGLAEGCAAVAALAWFLALVARADRGFHFRGPAAREPYLLHPPADLLRAHAREADLCDACRAAPWDYHTRDDVYLCWVCAGPHSARSGRR